VCSAVAVQRVALAGASHADAASDRPAVGRQHLQQDDQHDAPPQQTHPAADDRRTGNVLRTYTHAPTAFSKKCKASPYSIAERRVPELIPVLGSQPAGDVSHKPGGRLPLLSARPAVTPATMEATIFAARLTEAR